MNGDHKDPRDQTDKSIDGGSYTLEEYKHNGQNIVETNLQFQSLVPIPFQTHVGFSFRQSRLALTKYTIRTKAPKPFQLSRNDLDSASKYPKFNGYYGISQTTDKPIHRDLYKPHKTNVKKPKIDSKSGEIKLNAIRHSWDCDLWTICINQAVSARIEGEDCELSQQLKYFVKHGFPLLKPEFFDKCLCYLNIKEVGKFSQRAVRRYFNLNSSMYYIMFNWFWKQQHNKDKFFTVLPNGELKFKPLKTILKIKYDDCIHYKFPMATQIIQGASKAIYKNTSSQSKLTNSQIRYVHLGLLLYSI